MSLAPDSLKKKFNPLKDKTLHSAIAQRVATEFPRIGGPRMRDLCADIILETVAEHLQPRDRLHHGQVLWTAVAIDDPPRRGRRLADCRLVPVILDLSTPEDIDDRIARQPADKRFLKRAERLCRQAYEQGGLLSNCDLAELLNTHDSRIASVLAAEEDQNERVIPRRATLHDCGTGLTHKRIICLLRYRDGLESAEIARRTCHCVEAVDRYLGQYDRVRHCRLQGFSPQQTAYTLNCSLALVNAYLAIDQELETLHA